MDEKKSKQKIEIIAAGVLGVILGAFIMFSYHGSYLLPAGGESALSANSQLMNAQIFKYVNVSDLRINNEYYYPENCSNFRTDYTENNATTPSYLSAVLLSNNSTSEGFIFISMPYIINGHAYEYHYEISCKV